MATSTIHPAQKRINDLREIGKTNGHTYTMVVEEPMLDHIECQCGWKSRGYYDGQEFAFDDWVQHLRDNSISIPSP